MRTARSSWASRPGGTVAATHISAGQKAALRNRPAPQRHRCLPQGKPGNVTPCSKETAAGTERDTPAEPTPYGPESCWVPSHHHCTGTGRGGTREPQSRLTPEPRPQSLWDSREVTNGHRRVPEPTRQQRDWQTQPHSSAPPLGANPQLAPKPLHCRAGRRCQHPTTAALARQAGLCRNRNAAAKRGHSSRPDTRFPAGHSSPVS